MGKGQGTKFKIVMPDLSEIIEFVKMYSLDSKITESTDIFSDTILKGDDFHEFIEKYAVTFKVNMNRYLRYFHTNEDSGWNNIGGLFFAPPYKRVKRIPVTPIMLLEYANEGIWSLN